MKIVDINDNEIENPDLSKGHLADFVRIKPDATPIDGVTKHAWADDDYEQVWLYVEYTEDELAERAAREAETLERERRESWLSEAPEIQAAQDAAICELYETQMEMQDSFDAAICEMYELTIGGAYEA